MLKVSVKWQKEVFTSVELDPSQTPFLFKCQLYDLTGVPPERQKIMVKGVLLKDDADWSKLHVAEGQKFLMMGTAEVIPRGPETAPVFVEDLPMEDQHSLGYSAGLVNLGNTCYLNATLQCLHSVEELKAVLQRYSGSGDRFEDTLSNSLVIALRDIFHDLDTSLHPVQPIHVLMVLRRKFPQFAQHTGSGVYMQQDAEECWSQLLYSLSLHLPPVNQEIGRATLTVIDIFGIKLQNMVKCAESGEENFELETVYALKCHISVEVNNLEEGLKQGLTSELEKMSNLLGRSALHMKSSRISQLPLFLTVQFMRFYWKRESGKAKILRKVDYPLQFDAMEFCTEELKEKLQESRKGHAVVDSQSQLQSTGIYDLIAVLTHKGRSAESGHYVAWVKQKNGNWVEFDDDHPSLQHEDDITKLSGGGDWHMAYICLYKARTCETTTSLGSLLCESSDQP